MSQHKLTQIIDDLRARDFFPHRPICDNNGVIEVFAKYNFSFVVKQRMLYVIDADSTPVLLMVANDGNVANNGLFVIRDISKTPTGSDFSFVNTPANLYSVSGTPLLVDNASRNEFVLKTTDGFFSIITNGVYDDTSKWVFLKLPPVPGCVSQARIDEFYSVAWAANKLVVMHTSTGVVGETPAYTTGNIDPTPWANQSDITGDISAYGMAQIVPLGNREFALVQQRVLYTASSGRDIVLQCKFRVSTTGVVSWILSPADAKWKMADNQPNSTVYSGNIYGFYWHAPANSFYMTDNSHWFGYTAPKITLGPRSLPYNQFLKSVPVPDNNPISKSASPGLFFEVGEIGSDVYAIRAGADSKGGHYVLARYTNVAGVPTVVPNGLPDGSTTKVVLKAFTDTTHLDNTARTLFTVKKDNKAILYFVDLVLRRIATLTLDPATSDLKITIVKTYTAPTLPADQQIASVLYDQGRDRVYFYAASNIAPGKHVLYRQNSDVSLTKIAEHPSVSPTNFFGNVTLPFSQMLDLDRADPILILTASYTRFSGSEARAQIITDSGVVYPAHVRYTYGQAYTWSKLLNAYCISASPNGDQASILAYYDMTPTFQLNLKSLITFNLPNPVGLNGVINNGMIHIGGYTSNVYAALARNGSGPEFTLPANCTCYLYLERVGTDAALLRVSLINEANTFSKVQLAEFTTSAVGVLTTKVKTIGTF